MYYTHVINVNGAMTEFNMLKNTSVPCVKDLYQTANRFELLSPQEVDKLLATGNVFILDVRSDSAFRGISSDAAINAQGRFKGATNIPLAQLASSLNRVPTNVTVLVVGDLLMTCSSYRVMDNEITMRPDPGHVCLVRDTSDVRVVTLTPPMWDGMTGLGTGPKGSPGRW